MNIALMADSFVRMLDGALLTLELVALSLALGFAFAVSLALMRRSGNLIVSSLAYGYVFLFRGTPLLVQIFFVYYGIGQFQAVRQSFAWEVLREPFWCAVIALTLNTAAYGSEIVRGALDSVPKGQIEAARALGMSRLLTARLVILPLAVRQGLPAYGNEMILMVKASALASIITLMEVTGIARAIVSRTFAPLEVFAAAAAIYLAINATIAFAVRLLERRLSPERRPR